MQADDAHLSSALIGHSGHGFPWDIVVLAVLAVALGFRLYRTLGRRVGMQGVRQERPAPFAAAEAGLGRKPPPLPGASAPSAAAQEASVEYDIPAPATRVGRVLSEFARLDPSFSPKAFLRDVESAFRKVVPAFASGDRATLDGLLTPAAEESFLAAIDARVQAGETQTGEVKAIESLAILDAFLDTPGRTIEEQGTEGVLEAVLSGPVGGRIEVRIVSRQVNFVTDRDGDPVQGTDAVTEFHDLWLFERKFDAAGSRWKLAASRPA